MSPLADPENPPVPPCPCRCLCPDRDRDQNWDQHQNRDRDQNENWNQNHHQNRDLNRDQNWSHNQNQNRDRDQNWNQNHHQHQPQQQPRCRCRSGSRSRSRCRSRCRRLAPALAALAAAALGAAAAAAAVLGALRGQPPAKAATAAHLLLSAGSLSSSPSWLYRDGVRGVFLSGDIRPDAEGTLRVTSGGLYLLYGQLGVSCIAVTCPRGRVTLRLRRAASPRPLLAVPLALPDAAGGHRQRSALAQAVGQLWPGDALSLELVVDTGGDIAGDTGGDTGGDNGGWQLAQDEREGNFVGLLRIAGG